MTLKEFGLYNWRGGGGSAWFAPVAQARGSEGRRQMELAKEILGRYGFDYVAEYIVGWREGHHIIDLLFDKNNAEEAERANSALTNCWMNLLLRDGALTGPILHLWTRSQKVSGQLSRVLIKVLNVRWIQKESLHPGNQGFSPR